METSTLSRAKKILFFLYEHGKGKQIKVRYEDIVVGLFKKYPHDFQLKGYPEYPDSGDIIHKPLYDFKKRGYINAASKIFSLTERGLEYAQELSSKKAGNVRTSKDRLSRSTETEVSRVEALEGFGLFTKGEMNKLSDNDLYNYLGVTVRTNKNAFLGRLESMSAMREELKRGGDNSAHSKVIAYHDFLLGKYPEIINFFTNKN